MPKHSDNQMHGKSFENLIKAANGIFNYAAADRKRSPNDRFDIQAEDDRSRQFPTSIKSTQNSVVGLSDARLFWQSFNFVPYRILVGRYKQDGGIKVFEEIHEIILRDRYRVQLLGNVSEEEINEFHDGLRAFQAGRDEQSRASEWAQRHKRELMPHIGLVTLNPKIDSKNQRRLQCSISLGKLIEILKTDDYMLHEESFGNLPLPLRIASGRRRLRREP